ARERARSARRDAGLERLDAVAPGGLRRIERVVRLAPCHFPVGQARELARQADAHGAAQRRFARRGEFERADRAAQALRERRDDGGVAADAADDELLAADARDEIRSAR